MMDFNFKKYPGLRLVLLFGSRARGQAREESDWDFGYLAESDFDDSALYTDLVLALETDHVDLVDLSRANGLLRYYAASENRLIYESSQGVYENFWLEAVNFWCENAAIFRSEYDALLEGLG
ncbi:MAG: nucleotidyltransferase domain-containing protein [Parachlamydia sp.]|nr:nucleotidyltransferase domain-containing protein [Parachlamydia sp.]